MDDQDVYFHEKGRFRPLGPYLVHIALLCILIGGLIGKFWGIEGTLPVLQGETAEAFRVGNTLVPLNFQVRLDRFQVLYYADSPMPKEFRSDLTFLKDGKEEMKAVCRVNDPVSFGGLTFYQASYGSQPSGPVRLQVSYKERQETIEAPLRQMVELPGGEGRIMISKVEGNLQGLGPAVEGIFMTGRGMGGHDFFTVFQDHPEMNKPIGPYRLSAGVGAVPVLFRVPGEARSRASGGFMPVFSCSCPDFTWPSSGPTQRWAVVLQPTPKGGWQGRLLGSSPRAREDFDLRRAQLLEEFKKGTPS